VAQPFANKAEHSRIACRLPMFILAAIVAVAPQPPSHRVSLLAPTSPLCSQQRKPPKGRLATAWHFHKASGAQQTKERGRELRVRPRKQTILFFVHIPITI